MRILLSNFNAVVVVVVVVVKVERITGPCSCKQKVTMSIGK